MGLGGGRPRGYLPQPTIKLGRFEMGYSPPYDTESYTTSGFQLDADVWRFTGYNDEKAALTLGMGISFREQRPFRIMTETVRFSLLAGVDHELSPRSKFTVKVGVLNVSTLSYLGEYSYRYPELYTLLGQSDRVLPYGEIAYKWYLLPFAAKQKVIRRMVKGEVKIDKQKVKQGMSKWFNPYWSVGIGLDRAILVVPGGGVKIGPVQIDGSGIYVPEYTLSGGAKISVDILKIGSNLDKRRYVTLGASAAGVGGYLNGTNVYSLTAGMVNYSIGKRHSTSFNVGIGRWDSYSGDEGPITYDEEYIDQSTSDAGWMPTFGLSYNIYLLKLK